MPRRLPGLLVTSGDTMQSIRGVSCCHNSSSRYAIVVSSRIIKFEVGEFHCATNQPKRPREAIRRLRSRTVCGASTRTKKNRILLAFAYTLLPGVNQAPICKTHSAKLPHAHIPVLRRGLIPRFVQKLLGQHCSYFGRYYLHAGSSNLSKELTT